MSRASRCCSRPRTCWARCASLALQTRDGLAARFEVRAERTQRLLAILDRCREIRAFLLERAQIALEPARTLGTFRKLARERVDALPGRRLLGLEPPPCILELAAATFHGRKLARGVRELMLEPPDLFGTRFETRLERANVLGDGTEVAAEPRRFRAHGFHGGGRALTLERPDVECGKFVGAVRVVSLIRRWSRTLAHYSS